MIKVGTLAKIRRLYFRDKQSIKEICRQTGMSRNTVRSWLRDSVPTEHANSVVSLRIYHDHIAAVADGVPVPL